ncbi:hypothetical protein Tco_1152234 [Tanacetum coccineum]
MSIPEAMMSREIKESDAYLNYLAKYLNAQSGSLTLGRGQDPDQALELAASINLEENQQRDRERRSKAKHATLLLLNFKRGAKESKGQRILEEFRKTLGEGSGAAPNSLNHSDSSDNSIWESIDDDKTESDKDFDHRDDNDDSNKDSDHGDGNDYSDINFDAKEDQTAGFGILEDYNKFLNEPHEVEMFEQLNEPMYTETQTLTVVPLLETGVGILMNHTEVIKDSIKDNMPNFVPQAVSGYVHPRLERTDLDVIKKNPVNLFQSSFTPSVDTTEYELKHQLYEKMFETNAYLTHKKHRTLYGALQESMQGEKNIKRRKGVGGSSSKKEKAPDYTPKRENLKMLMNQDKNKRKLLQHDACTKEHAHWFKQPGEKRVEELPEQNWFNELVNADKDPREHKLQCHLAITDKIDWTNPERASFHNDLSKPLPLVGPPSRKTIPTRYLFNHDLEYLRHGNEEKKYALLVTKVKAARYEQEGIEELIPHLLSPSIHKVEKVWIRILEGDCGQESWSEGVYVYRSWFSKIGLERHRRFVSAQDSG